jgi:hypothetical protein
MKVAVVTRVRIDASGSVTACLPTPLKWGGRHVHGAGATLFTKLFRNTSSYLLGENAMTSNVKCPVCGHVFEFSFCTLPPSADLGTVTCQCSATVHYRRTITISYESTITYELWLCANEATVVPAQMTDQIVELKAKGCVLVEKFEGTPESAVNKLRNYVTIESTEPLTIGVTP